MKPIDVILKLLRIALGNESDYSLPADVDWPTVFELANRQGVAPLVCDGLNALYCTNPSLEALQKLNSLPTKMQFLSCSVANEATYGQICKTIEKLASLYAENDIRMMVMKGYAASLMYPIPSHRSNGDIDIFLYGKGEQADQLMKSAGIAVKQNEDKHSTFTLKGIHIENHATFLNVVEHPSLRKLEGFLLYECGLAPSVAVGDSTISDPSAAAGTSTISDPSATAGTSTIFVPTELHNALFLSAHIANHLVFTGATLKQLTDWAVFVAKYGRGLNWEVVLDMAAISGYKTVLEALNAIAVHRYGVSAECVPTAASGAAGQSPSHSTSPDSGRSPSLSCSAELEDRIFNEIVFPRFNADGNALYKIRRYFASQWKYRLVFRESPLSTFFRRGWAHFRERYLPRSRSVWG